MTEPDVPLLIHSLAEFRDLIFASLEAADARQVVEIGGEDGTFTRELVAWGRSRGAKVVCIDPSPRDSLEELARADESLSLVREPSVDALTSLPPCDAYLIDGDHNYFTVRKELQLIAAAAPEGRFPLVFLHDVGWPCGRRDQYYNPDLIPPEDRHEYTWDRGVVVGHPGVVEGGFRGEGAFAAAVREGGPRNGVLTAVEDFRRERPALSFHVVPAIFGLGVIFDPSRPFGERLEELL
ncbi:MAG: class I SAM-dependent methyltransferase, partial [Actinobacteria bacterium]|nr:class I SAM-dependent methyltransferase [Actinomycetota bacterium]